MESTPLTWFKTAQREGKTLVFDPLRRRWVALTPEEEVRQKTLYLLVEHLGVPAGRVAVEYSVKVNGMDRRADAVVFDGEGRPLMVVECKAATVALTDAVLDQAVRYHSAFTRPPFKGVPEGRGIQTTRTTPQGGGVKYLLLTNALVTYCYHAEGPSLQPMDHLPTYAEMCG